MLKVAGWWLALIFVAATPSFAHHSFALFDMDKNLTMVGTVEEYRWANPHVHVVVKVDPGTDVTPEMAGTWDLEATGSTNIMTRQGWTRVTLKAGDHVTAVVRPMKDGSKGGSLFYIILPDGNRMYTDIARPKSGS